MQGNRSKNESNLSKITKLGSRSVRQPDLRTCALTTITPELCSNSQPKETKASTNIFSFRLSWVLFITNLIILGIPTEILFEFFDPEWLTPKPIKGLASEKNYLTLQYYISIVFKNTISVVDPYFICQ